MSQLIVFGGRHSHALAQKIAKHKHAPYHALILNRFPDGESYVRFPCDIRGKEVVIVQTMQPHPNEGLLHAFFSVQTAHDLGAKKITLVAPYMAYMRQDKRFNPGECV